MRRTVLAIGPHDALSFLQVHPSKIFKHLLEGRDFLLPYNPVSALPTRGLIAASLFTFLLLSRREFETFVSLSS
jgi:hypothetical protein